MSNTTEQNKPFAKMNAREKTAHLGFKIFSDRELKDRQAKAVTRRVEGLKKFLQDLIVQPHFTIGKHLSEKEMEAVFSDPVNAFYDHAIEAGLTANDLESIKESIIHIAFMFSRTSNESSAEARRLVYSVTGENDIAELPLKDVIRMATVFKEGKPEVADQYDEEPSLSDSMIEEVTDVELKKEETTVAESETVNENQIKMALPLKDVEREELLKHIAENIGVVIDVTDDVATIEKHKKDENDAWIK